MHFTRPLLAVGLLLLGVPVTFCRSTAIAPTRHQRIKTAIAQNTHYSIHCRCTTVTTDTVDSVFRLVTVNDLGVLQLLLSDTEPLVRLGASRVLVRFGEIALPILEDARATVPESERVLLVDLPRNEILANLRRP